MAVPAGMTSMSLPGMQLMPGPKTEAEPCWSQGISVGLGNAKDFPQGSHEGMAHGQSLIPLEPHGCGSEA